MKLVVKELELLKYLTSEKSLSKLEHFLINNCDLSDNDREKLVDIIMEMIIESEDLQIN